MGCPAEQVTASLAYGPGAFLLKIADDGIGFDVAEVFGPGSARGSTGLLNIRKRASLIGAQVDIDSRPGEGSLVSIQIDRDMTKDYV